MMLVWTRVAAEEMRRDGHLEGTLNTDNQFQMV